MQEAEGQLMAGANPLNEDRARLGHVFDQKSMQGPGTQRHRNDEQYDDGGYPASGRQSTLRRKGRRTVPGTLYGFFGSGILAVYLIKPFSR